MVARHLRNKEIATRKSGSHGKNWTELTKLKTIKPGITKRKKLQNLTEIVLLKKSQNSEGVEDGKRLNQVLPNQRTEAWWRSELGDEWYEALKLECKEAYVRECLAKVDADRQNQKKVYPPEALVFNAFRLTPLSSIKVVIVGQDPYHSPGQAMGLCFSVPEVVKVPPSLINMYKEIKPESRPPHGNLICWAQQGVFLLNTILTVVDGRPLSHSKYGWEKLTEKVVQIIDEQCANVVFLLWGLPAKKKGKSINRERHFVLEAGHPSPLSVSHFRGCNHFHMANQYLIEHDKKPINWELLPISTVL